MFFALPVELSSINSMMSGIFGGASNLFIVGLVFLGFMLIGFMLAGVDFKFAILFCFPLVYGLYKIQWLPFWALILFAILLGIGVYMSLLLIKDRGY